MFIFTLTVTLASLDTPNSTIGALKFMNLFDSLLAYGTFFSSLKHCLVVALLLGGDDNAQNADEGPR